MRVATEIATPYNCFMNGASFSTVVTYHAITILHFYLPVRIHSMLGEKYHGEWWLLFSKSITYTNVHPKRCRISSL